MDYLSNLHIHISEVMNDSPRVQMYNFRSIIEVFFMRRGVESALVIVDQS